MRSVGKSGISQFTASWSTFGVNNAARRGGVIAITGGQVDLEESLIYDNGAESGGVVSACISEVKVQTSTRLLVMDDPANPQLCAFYDTDIDYIPPVTSRSEKFVSESKLNATFGVAITVSVVCLLLCVVITCIVLYLCGMLNCCKRRESGSGVDNTPVYVPLNERHD